MERKRQKKEGTGGRKEGKKRKKGEEEKKGGRKKRSGRKITRRGDEGWENGELKKISRGRGRE